MSGIVGWLKPQSLSEFQALSAQISHRGQGLLHQLEELWVDVRSRSEHHIFSTPELWIGLIGNLYSHPIEQILLLWKEHRSNIFSLLEGSFLLVVWEKENQRLHLFRSKEGIHPLYWSESPEKNSFVFCSELPPLLTLQWCSKELELQQLAEQLSFRYIHAPRTLIKGIYQLPAGEHLSLNLSLQKEKQQWLFNNWAPPAATPPRKEILIDQLSARLRRAVERRSQANVGVLLSGGLDSSAILHNTSTLYAPPKTYTVVLEGARSNEAPFAARVAKMMGAKNEVISITSNELIKALPIATRIIGAPLSTAAAAVQYLLFQKLKDREQVLLSGDGGDELLGGRSMPLIASRIQQVQRLQRLPYITQKAIQKLAVLLDQRDFSASYEHFGRDRSIGASRIFIAPDRVDIFSDPGLVRPGIRRTILTPFYQEVDSDPINEILHVWQRGWLTEDSLLRSERLASHAGIELRYPMLDHELVHYCASLPGSSKVKKVRLEYIAKWPLRELMSPFLSHRLLHRPKRTLLHPLDSWLCNAGAQFLHQCTDELCDDLNHIFVPRMVRKLRAEHLSKRKNHGLRLWSLILFSMWWRQLEGRD